MGSVRSVVHALSIIQLLAERGSLTLSEIARPLDLSPSSCLALLRTLVAEGVLVRERRCKHYTLAREWAAAGIPRLDPVSRATERLKPFLAHLAAEFEATAGLWTLLPSDRQKLVAYVESDTPMRIHMADGQRQPLGGGAVGRAFLAQRDVSEAGLAACQAATRWHKQQTSQDYAAEVARARVQGFAVDDGILHAGICSIATVLSVGGGKLCASLSVFSGTLSAEAIRQVGEILSARCRALQPPT